MFDKLSVLLLDLADIAQGKQVSEAMNSEQFSTTICSSPAEAHDRAVEHRPDLIVITTSRIDNDLLNLSATLEHANPNGRIYTAVVATAEDSDLTRIYESNVVCLYLPPEDWSVFSQQVHLLAVSGRKATMLEDAFIDASTSLYALNASCCTIDASSESCHSASSLLRLLKLNRREQSASAEEDFHWRYLLDGIHETDRQRLSDGIQAALADGSALDSEVALAESPDTLIRCQGTVQKTNDGQIRKLHLTWQQVSKKMVPKQLVSNEAEWEGSHELAQLSARMNSRASGTVLFVRIEGFPEICKTLGYLVGQQLLSHVRSQVQSKLRDSDIVIDDDGDNEVARIGGAELIAVLDEVADEHHVSRVKNRVRSSLEKSLLIGGRVVPFNVSLGTAVWPLDGSDANDLLISASLSADCSSADYKDDTPSINSDIGRARDAIRLEADLYDAVLNKELTLLYQPKYSLSDGSVAGVEALLRWHNKHKTWVQPDIFIPIAERNGLILPIGEWVIEEALSCHARWYKQGLGRIPMAINISAHQLADESIIDLLVDSCVRHDIPTNFIELEVTESCLIDNAERVSRILADLNAAGFAIALDDFGTGFSSLSYLQALPLDVLKIDRSFVNSLTENSYDPGLVAGIIGIGLTLGLRIVAEGIENETQWELLGDWGCHYGQGFMMSKPIAEQEAAVLIEEGKWLGAASAGEA